LRAADAGGRLQRKLAEQAQHSMALRAPNKKPNAVCYERGGDSHGKRERKADLALGRKCAGGQQYRHRRQGKAELLHQHPGEDEQVAIHQKNVCRQRHE